MTGEISYDLVMKEDMDFVEGSYRTEGGEWKVFIFRKASIEHSQTKESQWESGVRGIVVRLPKSARLNKEVVLQMMSESLKVNEWHEVRGPDSMQLR